MLEVLASVTMLELSEDSESTSVRHLCVISECFLVGVVPMVRTWVIQFARRLGKRVKKENGGRIGQLSSKYVDCSRAIWIALGFGDGGGVRP